MTQIGRILMGIGLLIAVIGGLLWLSGRFFPWLGNLPGDIRIERENFRLYFPLTTMILVSVIGSILLNLIIRYFRR